MNKLLILLIGLTACTAAMAKEPDGRHQVRIGWGDMMFETFAFRESPKFTVGDRRHDVSFTGHIFAGYRYALNKVTSVGVQADVEGIFWKETKYGTDYKPAGPTYNIRNYNLAILPEVTFTYFRSEWVRLHSGVALGVNIAFDNHSGRVEAAPALNLNAFGVEVGKGNFYGCLDIGALSAMNSNGTIYMLGSRLLSVSLNYRF